MDKAQAQAAAAPKDGEACARGDNSCKDGSADGSVPSCCGAATPPPPPGKPICCEHTQAEDEMQSLAQLNTHLRERIKKVSYETSKIIFTSKSQTVCGLNSVADIRQKHKVEIGSGMSGDKAPAPVEVLLAALGACLEFSYKSKAADNGMQLLAISSQLEGTMNTKFIVDQNVRPGMQTISVKLTIHAPTTNMSTIETIKNEVQKSCPVLDSLKSVDIQLKCVHCRDPKCGLCNPGGAPRPLGELN